MSVDAQPRRGGDRGRGGDRSLEHSPPFPAACRRLGLSVSGAATMLQMLDREARGSLVVRAFLEHRFGGSGGRDRQWGGCSVPAWAWVPFTAPCTQCVVYCDRGIAAPHFAVGKTKAQRSSEISSGSGSGAEPRALPQTRAPSNPSESCGDGLGRLQPP